MPSYEKAVNFTSQLLSLLINIHYQYDSSGLVDFIQCHLNSWLLFLECTKKLRGNTVGFSVK